MKLNFYDLDGLKFRVFKSKENRYTYLKGSKHRIPEIKINSDFALFLGLLWGDGWVVNRKAALAKSEWKIGMVENEKLLIDTFRSLSKKIFNITPNIRFRKTYYETYFNSRIVYEILTQKFNFPDGKKINRLAFPSCLLVSEELICPFLQGMFSTDGKFVIYKNYPRVGIESATQKLINDIEHILIDLDLKPRKYTWNRKNGNKLFGLYLNGKGQIVAFQKKIGFIGTKDKRLREYINKIAPK